MDNNQHPHYVWALVAVLAIGMIAWVYASNRPDTENYAKGSSHPEQSDRNYGIFVLRPSCQNIKAEDFMKGKKNDPIINKPAK